MTDMDCKATPSNDTDYICHIKPTMLVEIIIYSQYHATSYY